MVRLLNPKAAKAFHDWVVGLWALISVLVGDVNLDRFQRWLWGTLQEQQQIQQETPDFDQKIEALFTVYNGIVSTQHEAMALRTQIGKLPALPDEGY